jgi:hypothetical protein
VLKGLVAGQEEQRTFRVDSWQSLILAFRLAEIVLENEVRKGGTLFYLGEETSVPDLFGSRVRE